MKLIFQTIIVAFSMFSAVPMPHIIWNKQNMRYMMCAFPLIGAVIGIAVRLWLWICGLAGFSQLFAAAGACLIPVLITGGVHLDGFADTTDALSSHQSRERMLEIMKDSHMGAFAAIGLCVWFLADFGAWFQSLRISLPELVCLFVYSRSLSGLAVASFPMAKDTGLVHTFAEEADRKKTRIFLIILSVAMGLCMAWISVPGFVAALTGLAVFGYYRWKSVRTFGGITGDLAGWFLSLAELFMVLAWGVARVL